MINKKTIKKLYTKEYKTIAEIATHLNTTECKVSYWRKKHGIRKVERWERHGLREFSEKQNHYLYGSLLGDDSLGMSEDRRYPFLKIVHSSKQKNYVQWKYQIWKQIAPSGIKNATLKDKYDTTRFYTAAHPGFLKFWNQFYPNGKKIVSKEILNNCTPFSLAAWYMDDGYFRESRCRAQLCTNSFTYAENQIIRRYFKKKWGLDSNIGTCSTGTHYIWFNTENTIMFFKIIGKHIIPYFDYKIDMSRKLQWKKLSKKELNYIERNYRFESPKLIAKKLKRPLQTVFGAAWRLGVTESRGGRKIYQKTLNNDKITIN